ncbi:hypothetical protein BJ138DRAFT_1119424 [Hygrophoropsis aurantiaca]|uniref:Uncharacterized protein n=1 Tax=Hygrophoropsis aurantiaca TaxID=72124 RepID=A0ACB7ZU83_9AGAM|nr:hypothetical protein BJ138DRAFT_1119424 [Hygrophoropsis aurantiaca]
MPQAIASKPKKNKKQQPQKPPIKRRGWTTDAQEQFLESRKPSYRSHQSNKTLADFWPTIMEEWFTEFPLGNPTEKEVQDWVTEAERQLHAKTAGLRIQQWYNNHTRVNAKEKGGKRKFLDLRAKKRKMLQDYQAYSQLYYDERVRPTVETNWPARRESLLKDHKAGDKPIPEHPPLWYRNEICRELLADEDDDIKDEVDEYRKNPQDQDEPDSDEELLTPEEKLELKRVEQAEAYQSAQDAIPRTVANILEQIEVQAGMVGALILAGPRPERNGEIVMMSIFSGKNQLGNDFGQVYGSTRWSQYIENPLAQFAAQVFPQEERSKRTLPDTASGLTGREQSTSSSKSHSAASKSPLPAPPANIPDQSRSSTSRSPPPARANIPASTTTVPNTQANTKPKARPRPKPKPKSNPPIEDTLRASGDREDNGEKGVDVDADPFESDWDNGEPLTFEERVAIYDATQELGSRNKKQASQTKPKKAQTTVATPSSTRVTRSSVAPSTAPAALSAPKTPRGDKSDAEKSGDEHEGDDLDETKWPGWLVDAVDFLNSVDASSEWSNMVFELVKFERLLGFPKGMGKNNILSGTKRPEEIGGWIRGGRHFDKCLMIEDENVFANTFEQWWISLQPDW